MKNIIIVSNFYSENKNHRVFLTYNYFKEIGFNVKVYTADFNHYKKEKKKIKDKNVTYLSVISYKSNISLLRIISHVVFTFKVYMKIKKEHFDILYINIPPNILGYLLTKKYRDKKIIIDIIDLWPEALPFSQRLKNFLRIFFYFWKHLRNRSIKNASYILTHNYSFYDKLKLNNYKNSKVIYLKKYNYKFLNLKFLKNEVRILYIGNISYIYDFKSLLYISQKIKNNFSNIIIEIIGDGPLKEELLMNLKKAGINYLYHGIVFDEDRKEQIASRCQFGYNGYRSETEVSLSYKSIDYFSYGLPIINSAKGDTWNFVEKFKCGLNFNKNNLEEIIKILQSLNELDYKKMVQGSQNLFIKKFSYESYKENLKNILGEENE